MAKEEIPISNVLYLLREGIEKKKKTGNLLDTKIRATRIQTARKLLLRDVRPCELLLTRRRC